jgi:poly(A) polymerase
VQFGREIIEVATFRAGQDTGDAADAEQHQTDEGMLLRDNIYGNIEQDALRRDFTVNALYYNIADFSIIDYANGVADLQEGVLKLLGDPETRYREDPVRMLRAVRFATKLGFRIDRDTERPIHDFAGLLRDVPPARLFEEILKLFLGGNAVGCFEKLRQYGLFAQLFADTEVCLSRLEQEFPLTLVLKGLENTDNRVREDKPVTPAYLFAVLLWEPVRQGAEVLQAHGIAPYQALQQSAAEVVSRQLAYVSLPRRFSTPMQEIWVMQSRFGQTRGKRPQRLLAHPRFRAAYDFLLLRASAGEADPELAAWWTEFQQGNADAPPPSAPGTGRRRPRRRRGKRKAPVESQ